LEVVKLREFERNVKIRLIPAASLHAEIALTAPTLPTTHPSDVVLKPMREPTLDDDLISMILEIQKQRGL
jgi:hypothetical protein